MGKFCKECQCLDCTLAVAKDCPAQNVPCWKASYAGDGICDDGNNLCGCDWDGGDCCGDVNTKFCSKCECLDPAHEPEDCAKEKWKGDGNCDDNNNVESCEYDGGDCCGTSVKTKFCTKCECLDPSYEEGCKSRSGKAMGIVMTRTTSKRASMTVVIAVAPT